MEGILEAAVRFAFEKHEGQKRKGTDVRLKMLVLADKLSNLKSLYYDYKKYGEAV